MGIPRAVGINYRLGTTAFARSFVVPGLILRERQAGPLTWIPAALGLPTWPAYGAALATALSNALMRGWRGAGFPRATFAVSAFVSVGAPGFMRHPGTN